MADETAPRDAGKHEQARRLAEQAVAAEAAGDTDRAEELFTAAARTDATAVADVLQERAGASAPPVEQEPGQPEPETGKVQPGSDPPSRAGITETGSGADAERR